MPNSEKPMLSTLSCFRGTIFFTDKNNRLKSSEVYLNTFKRNDNNCFNARMTASLITKGKEDF